MSLPRISIEDKNFGNLVYQAMESKRGFILTNLSNEFTEAVNHLFKSFDDFRDQPDHIKIEFKGEKDGYSGYFSETDYKFGLKSGPRFFISRNQENKLTHALPKSKNTDVSMEDANTTILFHTERISDKILKSLEAGLGVEEGKIAKLVSKSSVMTISHYLPLTQEKLHSLLEHSLLTQTKDGNIKTFEQHKDISIFSMLIYRNNIATGLNLKIPDNQGHPVFEAINLNDEKNDSQGISIIIINGSVLQYLTGEKLRGLTHNVTTRPLPYNEAFWRQHIGITKSVFEDNLSPLVENQNQSKIPHENYQVFFKSYAEKYEKKIMETKLNNLADLILSASEYPREEEITREETDRGPVYMRNRT